MTGPPALQSLLLAIDQRDPAALRDALLEITDDSPDIGVQCLERSLGRFMARNLSPGLIPDAEAFADIFRIVSAYYPRSQWSSGPWPPCRGARSAGTGVRHHPRVAALF